MRGREISYKNLRASLSVIAAASAVLLCNTLHHFTIDPAHPSTWIAAAQHRCGLLLIATLTWLLYETIHRLIPQPQS